MCRDSDGVAEAMTRGGIPMDSLITAAARALAAGDPLGALKRVALRDDAPALALRGIAMAQLGDLVRAKALLRSAARAFGPKEAVARARCVVAEAEIALVSRDLGWPAKALDAARATLEAHGDRVNAAHARYLEVRRLLLIGRLDEAERVLAELDPAPFPPASRTAHELVVAGIAMRRLRTKAARAALARAERAARHAGIPALTAEVESALARPEHARGAPDCAVARSGSSCSRRSKRCWRRRRSSWTRAAMSCVTKARWSRSQRVRCCSRSHARWAKRGRETCRGTRSSRAHSERSSPMNRIARGCESKSGGFARMLRTLADVSATKRGFALAPRRAREVVVLARPVEEEHAAVLAFLADGESWSSSALALALGTSQRTVQRALDSLAAAGKVQSFGRGRARRWMTPPVPGFTTTLLLPAPLPID